jgi:hypothetical protein
VNDEPTLGEVVRRFDDRFTDIKEDIQQLGRRMDEKVDQRIYDLQHETLISRVSALETLRERDTDRIVATRRWLIGAVIVPLVGIFLPVILMLTRGGS